MEIAQTINWIDILMGVILIRVLYIGLKEGFVTEAFKLLGVLFSVFISLHYYKYVSRLVINRINLPQGFIEFLTFAFLWGMVVVVFMFVRQGFTILFKMEAHSALDRWGGVLLSLIRAVLLCSLTLVLLRLSDIDYINHNLRKSLTAGNLISFSTKFYQVTYDGAVERFFPGEEFNKAVLKLADFKSEKK